ncbi:Alpha-N-acetylgalactosaminidase [Eumeta japonica]|uniref:Alpha-N-acetylgalactosaminidase n=1 Tax=Eumeta variegata TaxID=151549 RepID=A0A4C1WGH5_EUMVA|nr:Alpha-N-acetylgalactosaminidase [Eumeta japonica]
MGSCSHIPNSSFQPNFTSIIEHCNLWRNFDDIQDSWASVESIIDYYGNHQDVIVPNAGPGHWNDPDMVSATDRRGHPTFLRPYPRVPNLIIGNFGLSYEQSKTQFAIWAILAAPLLMSVDLRTIRPEYRAILLNRKIIEVDQDPLGIQGRRIYKHRGIEIWSRPILPIQGQHYSYAVAFVNRRTDGTPSDVAVTLRELGLTNPAGYRVERPQYNAQNSAVLNCPLMVQCADIRHPEPSFFSLAFLFYTNDLYEDVDYGVLSPQTKIKVKVNPSGVVILRADAQPLYSYNAIPTRTPYTPLNDVFRLKKK